MANNSFSFDILPESLAQTISDLLNRVVKYNRNFSPIPVFDTSFFIKKRYDFEVFLKDIFKKCKVEPVIFIVSLVYMDRLMHVLGKLISRFSVHKFSIKQNVFYRIHGCNENVFGH